MIIRTKLTLDCLVENKRGLKILENRSNHIEKDTFQSLLLPALSICLIIMISYLFEAALEFLLEIFKPNFASDWFFQNITNLLIIQTILSVITFFVIIPFFKVKRAEFIPLNYANFNESLRMFFLLLGLTFLSNLLLTLIFNSLNWIPEFAYSEILLPDGYINNFGKIFLFLVTMTLGAAVSEEIVYRRLLIPVLENYNASSLTSVVISSLTFVVMHVIEDLRYGNIAGVMMHASGIFIFALVLGLTYVNTRNIIYPILIHACSNLFGSLSTLLTQINSEEILIIYSVGMLLMLLFGSGMTFYNLVRWRKRVKSVWNRIELNKINLYYIFKYFIMILPFSIVPCLWEFSIAVLNIGRFLQSVIFILSVLSLSLLLVRIANKEMVRFVVIVK